MLTDRTRSVADVVLAGVDGTPVPADTAAVLVSADALDVTERMLERTVEYARQRHQFGVPIGSFQAAKVQVAAQAADTALTRHGAIGCTWEHDLQLYCKRAKPDRVLFGSPSAWNERIAGARMLV